MLRRGMETNERMLADSATAAAALRQPACLVCFGAVETCFLPCGHACVCMVCAGKLFGQPCPVCRGTVEELHRIYLP